MRTGGGCYIDVPLWLTLLTRWSRVCLDFHGNQSWPFTAGACSFTKLKFSAWLHWLDILLGGVLVDHLPHSWAEVADKKGLIRFLRSLSGPSSCRHVPYLHHPLWDAWGYPSHLWRWRGCTLPRQLRGVRTPDLNYTIIFKKSQKNNIWVHQESYQLSPCCCIRGWVWRGTIRLQVFYENQTPTPPWCKTSGGGEGARVGWVTLPGPQSHKSK